MKVTDRVEDQTGEKETCVVVVIYEDAVTRQRAMAACDFLMQQLWSEVEFDFHWWRADFLQHAIMAHAAAKQAVEADFLIYCSGTQSECSSTVKSWFNSWAGNRHGRDGLLLNLTTTNLTNTNTAPPVETFLRGVARRAMLDYFATGSQTLTGTLPSSFEEAEQRASEMSSVLDEILHPQPRPPRFGLNE
jgi:hypothetical protein